MSKRFEPSVSHRFLVTFFLNRVPSPMDMRFQRVSGLGRECHVSDNQQGGSNLQSLYLPERVSHGTLTLERGVMDVSRLSLAVHDVLGEFKFRYMDVVIILLDYLSIPVCSWTVNDAMPVRWQTGDLDANSNSVLINTIELAYS